MNRLTTVAEMRLYVHHGHMLSCLPIVSLSSGVVPIMVVNKDHRYAISYRVEYNQESGITASAYHILLRNTSSDELQHSSSNT